MSWRTSCTTCDECLPSLELTLDLSSAMTRANRCKAWSPDDVMCFKIPLRPRVASSPLCFGVRDDHQRQRRTLAPRVCLRSQTPHAFHAVWTGKPDTGHERRCPRRVRHHFPGPPGALQVRRHLRRSHDVLRPPAAGRPRRVCGRGGRPGGSQRWWLGRLFTANYPRAATATACDAGKSLSHGSFPTDI